ncbi:unnamed protein product, partial [Prorocentrum cordatum]
MSSGLSRIIDPSGPLAKTELGPEMVEFNARVRAVVNSTAGKSDKKSLEQLKEVMGSVTSLVKDLNQQQMRLMQEGEEQRESLLLGVLMAQKGEPMQKQLEVLGSPEFVGLAASKAVLAGRDTKTPLFQQVANFLDAHGGGGGGRRSAAVEAHSAAVAHVVASLRARLAHLEQSARHAEDRSSRQRHEEGEGAGEDQGQPLREDSARHREEGGPQVPEDDGYSAPGHQRHEGRHQRRGARRHAGPGASQGGAGELHEEHAVEEQRLPCAHPGGLPRLRPGLPVLRRAVRRQVPRGGQEVRHVPRGVQGRRQVEPPASAGPEMCSGRFAAPSCGAVSVPCGGSRPQTQMTSNYP